MPRPPVQPIVFKPAVAAEMLQVSRQQIYNLIASGDLRGIQIGSTRSVRCSCRRCLRPRRGRRPERRCRVTGA